MFGPPIIIPGRTLRAAELPVQKDLSAVEQSLLPPNRVCCFHHSCRNRRHTTMTTTTTTTTTSATQTFSSFPKVILRCSSHTSPLLPSFVYTPLLQSCKTLLMWNDDTQQINLATALLDCWALLMRDDDMQQIVGSQLPLCHGRPCRTLAPY